MSFVTTPGQHEKTSPGNVNKYSPDQERDDAGRFGSGGGGGGESGSGGTSGGGSGGTALTYSDGREWGNLTTDHGIPVLVVGGRAYGPKDIVRGLPNEDIFGPTTAAALIANWALGARSKDERLTADTFLRQWPDGPQVGGTIFRDKTSE